MCGVCGIYDSEQRPDTASRVRQMAATLQHRGPDNDGFYDSPACVLGHRRLRIIDLSPLGHQPMCNEDASIWITFNGEIYNYLELREELVKRGHLFRSRTDTEVILHLYEEVGDACLERLNGMFALAIWDAKRERLLVARDRFGKKPLYYTSDGRRFRFASELKALLVDRAVSREIDPEALSLYVSLGYIPCPRTIFRGCLKLPPASKLVVERDASTGGLKVTGPERYWTVRYAPDARLTEPDCLVRIQELLRDAVRIRMYSDVPLGAFLSGGVDSSAVVAQMAAVSERPVETFSIGFDQASFDELRYAEVVAKQAGTNHHVFRCAPDALEVLPTLVHHFDEPMADASAVPTYYVSRIARTLVTVALSGDGGDEIFAGYTRYDNAMRRWQRMRALPGPLIRGGFRLLSTLYPRRARGWGILNRHALRPLEAYIADMSAFLPSEVAVLVSQGKAAAGENTDVFALARRLAEASGNGDFLSQMQYVDQMLYLPDDILVKVDRASMAVSLEVRAPLLDYRLAEFMATVPSRLRYHGGETKYLLKKAMEGVLPREILYRDKMGFEVPLKHWFREGAREFARDVLLSRECRTRGFFDPEEVERILDRHGQGDRDFAQRIWTLLFFELWCRHWLDDPLPDSEVARPPAVHVQ
jgi:asparagine synthase (glutamine-hydrolysing)